MTVVEDVVPPLAVDGQPSPSVVLRRLVDGYQISQALYVVATLGIADFLTNGGRTAEELSGLVGAHAESLYRVLRALASVGVFQEHADRSFSLTPVGDCLRAEAAQPVGAWAAFIGRQYHWSAWAHLLETVRTGEPAFVHTHGVSGWEHRARNSQENAVFDRAMTDLTRRASRSILDAHDFGRYRTVMDVGGGRGALLAAILARHSHVRGILFDQVHVVADSASVLDAAGVTDRCQVVGGSFFDGLPRSADACVLKTVLHDWDDANALRILRQCHEALAQNGILIVVEWDLAQPGTSRDAKFSDLQMMVGNGGRARTESQLAALLAEAGFALERSTPTPIGLAVIEAVAL